MTRSFAAPLIALTLLFASSPAAASMPPDQVRQVLIEAQRDYDQGIGQLRSDPTGARAAFRSAADRYQLAADAGVVSGALEYNLGNAHLQSGDVGRAILHYRRAGRLMPGDERLEANLTYARTLVRSQIAPSGTRSLLDALLAWHRSTSTSARWWMFALCNAALWLGLAVQLHRPIASLKVPFIILAAAWATLGLSVAADVGGWASAEVGVVLRDDVVVRKGNGLGFEPQFEQPLHAGVEFQVREQRGDWLHIELPDGKTGWIESAAVAVV